jgi:hypothetical protein
LGETDGACEAGGACTHEEHTDFYPFVRLVGESTHIRILRDHRLEESGYILFHENLGERWSIFRKIL